MKKDFLQFTYAYTNTKFGGGGDGAGIFTRTNSNERDYYQECTNLSNIIIQCFQHNYANNDKSMQSFGYNFTNGAEKHPYIFTAFNNKNFDAEHSIRGGEEFAAHVCVGDALISSGYAIEYYKSKKNKMTLEEIDKADVSPYDLLSDNEVENSKGTELTTESIRKFQATHLGELAVLLKYLLTSLSNNKKIFIVADDERKNDIAKWMAAVLMLLPPVIANKISFNTYMPDPGDDSKIFNLCGAVSGMSSLNNLSEKGYVFRLGSQLVPSSNVTPSSNKLADFLSKCDEVTFRNWIKSIDNYYQYQDITFDDVDYLVDRFILLNQDDVPICKTTEFVLNNANNHRFDQGDVDKMFFELTSAKIDTINANANDGYAVVKTLIQLMASPYINSLHVAGRLSYYLFDSPNSAVILSRAINEGGNEFFGKSTGIAMEHFTADKLIEVIGVGLKNNFFGRSEGRVDPKVIGFLIWFFSQAAFEKDSEGAKSILSMCAKEQLSQGKINEVLEDIFSDVSIATESKIRFLVELSINDGRTKHILDTTSDKNNSYAMLLIKKLKSCQIFDRAMGIYSRDERNIDIMRLFFREKWAGQINSLDDILNILKQDRNYSGEVRRAFGENFENICERNFSRLLADEIAMVYTLSLDELVNKKYFIREFLEVFKRHMGSEHIYVNRIEQELKEIIDTKINEERELNVVRDKRIDYILQKYKQLPDSKMLKLLKNADIELMPKSEGADIKSIPKSDYKDYDGNKAAVALAAFLSLPPLKKEVVDKKIEVCNIIDKASEQNRATVQLVKDIKKTAYAFAMSIVFALIVAALTGLSCYFIYNGIGNGFFATAYYVFTGLSFIVALVVYWQNFNILWSRLRIALTIFETACIVISSMSIYLLILQIWG